MSHGRTPCISLSGGAALGPRLEGGYIWEAGPLLGPPFYHQPTACMTMSALDKHAATTANAQTTEASGAKVM